MLEQIRVKMRWRVFPEFEWDQMGSSIPKDLTTSSSDFIDS